MVDLGSLYRKVVPGGAVSIVALAGVGVFLAVMRWNSGISRFDLEGLFEVSFIQNKSMSVWRDDGISEAVGRDRIGAIGEVHCRSASKQRQPTVHYQCLYMLTGTSGESYRTIIGAEFNRGWKRYGMADWGDYRLVGVEDQDVQSLLSTYPG